MSSCRPPPGLEQKAKIVSLMSIASLLIPTKKLEEYDSSEQTLTVEELEETQKQNNERQSTDDRLNEQKRSTELAAVANNCALNDDFEAAISFYSQAIELNPFDFRFYCNRSFCYETVKQYKNALEDAETAIKLNSYRPKPYFRKGRALLALKEYEEAEEAFQQVLKIDPDCEATITELTQLRYTALREIGFDVDAALLAAKRCTKISEAIDFVVNIELLTLKTDQNLEQSIDMNASDKSNGNSNKMIVSLVPGFEKMQLNFEKQNKNKNKCSVENKFRNDSPLNGSNRNIDKNFYKNRQLRPQVEPTNLFGYKGLWVGNISPKTNLCSLQAFFSKYGKVNCVKILRDKFCAFICYDNPYSPRKAVASLHEARVDGISNEYRPLKFRFIPTGEQPDLNFARPVQPRNNNDECYFWRTTGCNAGDKCKLRHFSVCRGIDFQPWMRR